MTCPTGKKRFAEKEWAIRFTRKRSRFRNQRPYKCHLCQFWHLTSANGTKRYHIREALSND